MTRALHPEGPRLALAAGGPGRIQVLLADARDAAGPLLAWLKWAHGIDAPVRLPEDRRLYEEVQWLAATGSLTWRGHRYGRVRQGHKERCTGALAGVGQRANGDSYRQAAAATLWAGLSRPLAPQARPVEAAGRWGAPASGRARRRRFRRCGRAGPARTTPSANSRRAGGGSGSAGGRVPRRCAAA